MRYLQPDPSLARLLEAKRLHTLFSDFGAVLPAIRWLSCPGNTFLHDTEAYRQNVLFLLSGTLCVHANRMDGSTMLIRRCEDLILLGDMELMGYTDTSNTVQTKTKCVFAAIDRTFLQGYMLRDSTFLLTVCRSLAEKLARFGALQTTRQMGSAEQNLADRIRERADERNLYQENLRDAAMTLGISYRHLHRLLHGFVVRGILAHAAKGYRVLDAAALKQIAEPVREPDRQAKQNHKTEPARNLESNQDMDPETNPASDPSETRKRNQEGNTT